GGRGRGRVRNEWFLFRALPASGFSSPRPVPSSSFWCFPRLHRRRFKEGGNGASVDATRDQHVTAVDGQLLRGDGSGVDRSDHPGQPFPRHVRGSHRGERLQHGRCPGGRQDGEDDRRLAGAVQTLHGRRFHLQEGERLLRRERRQVSRALLRHRRRRIRHQNQRGEDAQGGRRPVRTAWRTARTS
ncbi:hypothetical protein IE53DRAFT_413211, partial [Violaceomyces palustris]